MKKLLVCVSILLLSLVGRTSNAARGIGGSGGGPGAAVMASAKPESPEKNTASSVTVEVCNGGEPGTLCRTITYTLRTGGKPFCTSGEDDNRAVPCPGNGGKPNWLRKLNEAFESANSGSAKTDDNALFMGE